MSARTNSNEATQFMTFQETFPYFIFSTDTVMINIAEDINILTDYFNLLAKANTEIMAVCDECVELSKHASTLKQKCLVFNKNRSRQRSTNESLDHNIKMLRKMKNLAKNTVELISQCSQELQNAYLEMTKQD